MVPSVQHLHQELLSVLNTLLHICMCPPKVLQVQNRQGLDASSFRAKFSGNVTAGQCMCCREYFTHWFSNFRSYYMRRDESCLVANSSSEPKFSEFMHCQKMVEILATTITSVSLEKMIIRAMQLCLAALTACGIIRILASSWSVSRFG